MSSDLREAGLPSANHGKKAVLRDYRIGDDYLTTVAQDFQPKCMAEVTVTRDPKGRRACRIARGDDCKNHIR